MNPYVREIVRLEPCTPLYEGHVPSGFTYTEGSMTVTVSDEGRAQIAKCAMIWDAHATALNAFMDVYGMTRCAHNRPLHEHEWDVCTYWFDIDSDETPQFMLSGFHWDVEGEPYCMPYGYSALGFFYRFEDAR